MDYNYLSVFDGGFIKNYISLSLEEKNEILNKLVYLKCYNQREECINKLDEIYNYLNQKVKNDNLNKIEHELFIKLTSRYIINNIPVDDDLLNAYTYKYVLKNPNYIPEEIVFLINSFRIFLNTYFNKKIKFKFKNLFHIDYEFGTPINKKNDHFLVNVCAFKKLIHSKNFSKIDYNNHLTYITYILIHEYAHVLQQDYIVRNDNDITENYKLEYLIMKNNPNIYEKYHDYFDIEYEADLYAKQYIIYFLMNIISINELQDCIKSIDKKTDRTDERIIEKIKLLKKIKVSL